MRKKLTHIQESDERLLYLILWVSVILARDFKFLKSIHEAFIKEHLLCNIFYTSSKLNVCEPLILKHHSSTSGTPQ